MTTHARTVALEHDPALHLTRTTIDGQHPVVCPEPDGEAGLGVTVALYELLGYTVTVDIR